VDLLMLFVRVCLSVYPLHVSCHLGFRVPCVLVGPLLALVDSRYLLFGK